MWSLDAYLILGNIASGSLDFGKFGLIDKSDILGKGILIGIMYSVCLSCLRQTRCSEPAKAVQAGNTSYMISIFFVGWASMTRLGF